MNHLQNTRPVGINTDFIRDQPLALSVDSGLLSGNDTIMLPDGTPLLKVKRDLMSSKSRMHFVEPRSESVLFDMTKERFHSKYYAEHPDGSGRHLFDIDIDSAFMGGPTLYASFANAAEGGAMVRFEFKVHTFDSSNAILWDGKPIAEVTKGGLTRSRSMLIAPLVDPLIIIAMEMALTDRIRKRRNAGSSASAAGNLAM